MDYFEIMGQAQVMRAEFQRQIAIAMAGRVRALVMRLIHAFGHHAPPSDAVV